MSWIDVFELPYIAGTSETLAPGWGELVGAALMPVGRGPIGPIINSGTQQAIVEAKAGFNFSDVTIRRYVSTSRTVNAVDLRRAVSGTSYADPGGAPGANAYYTTLLKNGKSYNLKVIYNEETNTLFHFHYSRSAMGPLPKIKK